MSKLMLKEIIGSGMSNLQQKVIIVGAGAAGIAAATRLYENGIEDVLVLEAENRVGGRIYTYKCEDIGTVELGAQWIHGATLNAAFELASAKSVHMDSDITFDEMKYFRSTGEKISNEICERIWSLFQNIQADVKISDIYKFNNCGEFFISKLKEQFAKSENSIIKEEMYDEIIEYFHQGINNYDACDTWFDSSHTSLSEYRECDGHHYIMWKNGYHSLFDILMEKCQTMSNGKFKDENIILNTEVEKISSDANSMKVHCQDGRIFDTKHVILTVSLGVLKENYKNLFEGIELSAEKINTINGLNLGTVDKIYLSFPYRWWPIDNKGGFSLLWTKEDRQKYEDMGLKWLTDIFAVTLVEHAPLVLCGWISGPSARIMEQLDEEKIMSSMKKLLEMFLGASYEIPCPLQLIRSTWFTNKHFRGSYSYRSPETDNKGVSASMLATPIVDKSGIPIVLFAGEASNSHYYSTVHGALETGWREANRLLSLTK